MFGVSVIALLVMGPAVASAEDGDVPEEEAFAEEESSTESEDDDLRQTSLRDRISPTMNHEGTLGFGTIGSAMSPGERLFQLGLLSQATRGSDLVRFNDEHRAFAANLVLNASITENVAAHLQFQARNSINDFGRPQSILAQGDMSMGLMGRAEVEDGVWLGGDLSLYFPSGFDGLGLSPSSTSVRPRLMASFDFDAINGQDPDLYVPLVAHLNVGYRFDNTENLVPEGEQLNRIERRGYGISAYDQFEIGLGVEAPLPYVTPHLGWQLGIPVRGEDGVCDSDRALDCVSTVGGSSFPQVLTWGAKVEPVSNLGLHGGMDIGLTGEHAEGLPATYPYQFNFGMSYQIDPQPPTRIEESEVEAPFGQVLGRVIDEETGEPVEGVRVRYGDQERSVQLTGDDGQWSSYRFEPGMELAIHLEHEDFEATTVDWVVEEGETTLEEKMKPHPRAAVVQGHIEGWDEDMRERGATVWVRSQEGEVREVSLDEEGRFEEELDGEAYSLAVVMEGFLSESKWMEVEAGESYEVAYELREVEEWLATRSNGTIDLEEDLDFEAGLVALEPGSAELLDHVAAVIAEHPEVDRIEIQGHTSNQGDEDELVRLSQERAELIRDALVERGIDPKRLEAEGYGGTEPLLPNTSSRNRATNERIEIHLH